MSARLRRPARLAWLLAMLLTSAVWCAGASAATVSVAPADTSVNNTGTFTLRLEVDAVSELKAYKLVYAYPGAKLEFLGATEGEVLTSGGLGTMFVRTDTAPHDTVWVDCARLEGTTSGPGVLAYLEFKALAVGLAPIECRQVDFRDGNNVALLPACEGGVVRITAPVPVLQRSWGALKLRYR
jgi:hypothetical protein